MKKPYLELTDAQKVMKNWKKTRGLFKRGEYSVAIIRAATVAELMTNLAIRHELVTTRALPVKFVDHLLVWANGITGKFQKLLVPILEDSQNLQRVKVVGKDLKKINDERNKVVHKGEFKKRATAVAAIGGAHKYVSELAFIYLPNFQFDDFFSGNPANLQKDNGRN